MRTPRRDFILKLCRLAAVLAVAVGVCRPALAQTTQPTADDNLIALNFPENLELKTLVDYVSQRLGFNVSYQEEQLLNQRVTIKAPARIPADALFGLLQSMLKARGLAVVDGDQPGWKRIVPLAVSAVPTSRPAGGRATAAAPSEPVAQVFYFQNADAQRVDAVIKPFLSGSSASSFGVAEQHMLLVVDYASNMARIAQLVKLLDQPNQSSKIAFVAVHNADARQLAPQVKQILNAKAKGRPSRGSRRNRSRSRATRGPAN